MQTIHFLFWILNSVDNRTFVMIQYLLNREGVKKYFLGDGMGDGKFDPPSAIKVDILKQNFNKIFSMT